MDTSSKTHIALIIGIMLFLPVSGLTLEVVLTEGQEVEVIADALNVRSGATITTPLLGTVKKGDRLKILERSATDKQWYKVSYRKGGKEREGWILTMLKDQPLVKVVETKAESKDEHQKVLLEREQLKKENAQLRAEKAQLEKEVEKLSEQVEHLKKRSKHEAGIDALKALQEAGSEGDTQKELKQLKAEMGQLEAENQRLKERLKTSGMVPFNLTKEKNQFIWELHLPKLSRSMKFVFVESGRFPMGLSSEEVNLLIRASNMPTHEKQEIRLERQWQTIENGFLLGKYEVTHSEYQALLKSHRYASHEARKPVTNLTDPQIRDFCQALNDAYPQLHIGLPTEREWEYAAKGAGGSPYPWGHTFVKGKANVGTETLQEVGQYPESDSWCGASDMVGNAAEVCEIDTENYVKEADKALRLVARGGSYTSDEYLCWTTVRHLLWEPKSEQIGFRVVIRLKK